MAGGTEIVRGSIVRIEFVMHSNREEFFIHGSIFFVAVFLNLAWEVAQIHAYDFPESRLITDLIGCFIPSLGDGLMILIIYWTGWVVFQSPKWILSPGSKGYLYNGGSRADSRSVS